MNIYRIVQSMISFIIVAVLAVAGGNTAFAQLNKLHDPNMYSEVDIFVDDGGNKHATVVNVRFGEAVLISIDESVNYKTEDIDNKYEDLKYQLGLLREKYGDFIFEKKIKGAVPGGNPVRHRSTGEIIYTTDYSQLYTMRFAEPVPIEEIIDVLSKIGVVENAEGPRWAILLDKGDSRGSGYVGFGDVLATNPNDWGYINGHQWYLTRVNAEQAWDFSKGNNIKIGITDLWDSDIKVVHDDLNGRLTKHSGTIFGGHGTKVSGMAGAITNNGSWHASLGWNVELEGYVLSDEGIVDAMLDGVDVINCSWYSGSSSDLEDAVYDALRAGIVVVAGVGNGPDNIPTGTVAYPAAYNFPSARHSDLNAQVIAVAASDINDRYLDTCTYDPDDDVWIPDQCPYNYSPGTNPLTDPTRAFIDVAAPGISVNVLYSYINPLGILKHDQIINSGTSFSAPMVSALVALMKSANSTLTPLDIYNIITQTAAKVGQKTYNANGWNQYFGYGRINAYLAVCSVSPTCSLNAPSGLVVSNAGSIGQRPILTWNAPPGAIRQYKIYRQNPGSSSWINIGSTTNRTYTDLGVRIAQKTGTNNYSYRVTAVNYGSKETSPSNIVSLWGESADREEQVMVSNDEIPKTFRLNPNYPNPFNPSTTIGFELPEMSHVSLVVYDMMGREVARLIDSEVEAGIHNVTFDAFYLPSGMYMYRFVAGAYNQNGFMVLHK